MLKGVWLGWISLAWACAPLWAATNPAPASLLPADTLGFVTVPNWPATAAALRQNPMAQLWADPALRAFRESFAARFKKEVVGPLEAEWGADLASLAGLFQGQVTLAYTPTPPAHSPGPERFRGSFLLLADTGAQSARLPGTLALVRKKWTDAGRPIKTVRIRDLECLVLTISLSEVTRVVDEMFPDPAAAETVAPATSAKPRLGEWTVGQSGSFLIVSDSAREIERALALQASNAPPALADAPVFAVEAARFRDAQVCAWVNMQAALNHLGKDAPAPAGGGGGEQRGALSLGALLRALGFGHVQTGTLTVQESRAGTAIAMDFRVSESNRKGLFQALRLEPQEAGPPPFVPADVVKFARARLDLPRAWTQLEATLAEASPAAAGIFKFMINTAGKDKDEKFDLRERLVSRLGNDLITYEKSPRPEAAGRAATERALFLVGAPNPEQVVAAMHALPSLLPLETTRRKEREFLGRAVYSVTLPRKQEDGTLAVGPAWHYTAGASHAALSSDAVMIEEYLRGSDGVRRALRDQPGLAEAAQQVGGLNTGFFSYRSTSESARSFFESARKDAFNAASILGALKLGNQLRLVQDQGVLSWCDFYLLPSYERVAKYFHFDVSTLSLSTNGYLFRFFAPVPPGLRK